MEWDAGDCVPYGPKRWCSKQSLSTNPINKHHPEVTKVPPRVAQTPMNLNTTCTLTVLTKDILYCYPLGDDTLLSYSHHGMKLCRLCVVCVGVAFESNVVVVTWLFFHFDCKSFVSNQEKKQFSFTTKMFPHFIIPGRRQDLISWQYNERTVLCT